MSSHRPASGGRGQVRLLVVMVVAMAAVLVAMGLTRTRRVAQFAPLAVIESREPLQELPVRVAAQDEPVEPAHTYDAIVDLSNLRGIVVGVDLDYVMKGLPRYDAVIRSPEDGERFRGRIEAEYFDEGRFMLRLFSRRFPPGEYTLDIEGFDEGAAEGRIIASSWFQVTR